MWTAWYVPLHTYPGLSCLSLCLLFKDWLWKPIESWKPATLGCSVVMLNMRSLEIKSIVGWTSHCVTLLGTIFSIILNVCQLLVIRRDHSLSSGKQCTKTFFFILFTLFLLKTNLGLLPKKDSLRSNFSQIVRFSSFVEWQI